VTESQSGLLEAAVQPQLSGAFTLNMPAPPAEPTLALEGLTEYEQTNPLCVTVNVAVPTLIAPKRMDAPAFGATVNRTVPMPEPVPEVMVIQPALAWADHEQPCAVETVKLPGPPDAVTVVDVGESEVEQLAPVCVIWKTVPETVMLPTRWLMLGFGLAV
jgi:hypothetical protein